MQIERIKKELKTKYLGQNIIYHETIDSTQKEAKELAINNIENGTLVITDMQTNGIGTHGRKWLTDQSKNILMTLIIYPDCNIDNLEGLTIDIANCLVDVVKKLYNIKLYVKEPNDLILNGKKIAGILTETKLENSKVKNLFIGIGFNVNQEIFPEEIENIATSLKRELAREFQREDILIEFFTEFEAFLETKIR